MLRVEIPYFGVIPNRAFISVSVGALMLAGGIGFWAGNGRTTENAIAHIADRAGLLNKEVKTLKTTQVDSDKPTPEDRHTGLADKTGTAKP